MDSLDSMTVYLGQAVAASCYSCLSKALALIFLNASASAKIVNIGTFSSALLFFIPTGHVLWEIGLMIAACNVLGAFVGVFLALRYGSQFIRIFFLFLLVFLIIRIGIIYSLNTSQVII